MMATLKWLIFLSCSSFMAIGGILVDRLTSAPKNVHFSSFINNVGSKPMMVLWVNGSCPLSRQYVPNLRRCIRIAKGHEWNTLLVSVNDTVCDPLFQELNADYYWQDLQGTLAQRFNISVIPSALLFRSKPRWQEPAASVAYRSAIDNWAWETGKHRVTADEHFLEEAMAAMASGASIKKSNTKSYGCFIEIKQ